MNTIFRSVLSFFVVLKLTALRGCFGVVGRADAHVILRELVAGEHFGPWEPVRLHDGFAALADALAQPAAWVDGLIHADRCKQRAQEDACARMAGLVHQRHPTARLLPHLGHGLVLKQVGQQHLVVADTVAQAQVIWDGHALRRLVIGSPATERIRLPAWVLVLRCRAEGHQVHHQCQHSGGLPEVQGCRRLHHVSHCQNKGTDADTESSCKQTNKQQKKTKQNKTSKGPVSGPFKTKFKVSTAKTVQEMFPSRNEYEWFK